MKITKTRLEQIIREELKRYKEAATEAIFDPNEFKVIYREVQGSLHENPAAMAAAAMAATQLRNQQGKQIKATTALNDKSHTQHDKAKSMFQRLKDKFSGKKESVVDEGKLSSQIKKAVMIAIQMSGNMTGATDKIEKIKKGLSKDKKVADALRLANESINEAKSLSKMNTDELIKHWEKESKTVEMMKDKKQIDKTAYRVESGKIARILNHLGGLKKDMKESVNEAKFDATGVDWSGEMMWKWVSKALKTAGIKELKYTPMKSGWLGGKFIWGGFYQVQANKRKDVLPFTVDKKGNLHLNVSPNKFVIGKIGKLPQVVKNLKDFKKSDLDVYESVNEAVSPKGWNMSKKFITILAREVKNLQKYHRQQNDEDFLEVANYMELQLKYMKKNLNESVNEGKLNESLNTKFEVHPTDPDQTERSFVAVFKELAKGHGSVIDYGPRETATYDWNNQSNYDAAIKEYNVYMKKIAMRLNSTVHDMNNIWKVWKKISTKHRKKDQVNETKESVTVTRSELKELVGEVIKEGKFQKLGVPTDRASKVRLLAIMKKLRIPLAGPKAKVGYTLSQKGNKGILTVPSKYFDDVIEQMIKMNISVHSA